MWCPPRAVFPRGSPQKDWGPLGAPKKCGPQRVPPPNFAPCVLCNPRRITRGQNAFQGAGPAIKFRPRKEGKQFHAPKEGIPRPWPPVRALLGTRLPQFGLMSPLNRPEREEKAGPHRGQREPLGGQPRPQSQTPGPNFARGVTGNRPGKPAFQGLPKFLPSWLPGIRSPNRPQVRLAPAAKGKFQFGPGNHRASVPAKR